MPRAGSQPVPPAPMSIGEVANPPFAVVPDPARTFRRRAERLEALAAHGSDLSPYLDAIARIARVQEAMLADLPAAALPPADEMDTALRHGMPPLGRSGVSGAAAEAAFDALLARLDAGGLPAPMVAAIDGARDALPGERLAMMNAVLNGEVPPEAAAVHVLAAAALQVHMTRLAAQLDPKALKRITDGACPACGSAPVASAVVAREGSANTRFCTCALCATEWHVVRVRCLSCGSEGDITFHSVEGGSEHVKAETCRACRTYVKIVYQVRDGALDPLADDIASLPLDLLLGEQGYRRGSANPFLLGY